MPENHKKKNFLNVPRYPGGSAAFREFISKNLRYPPQALELEVEGFVMVEYEIPDNGKVQNPRILKSLGHGCDEEALRLIGMLRFEKVKNRGVRLTMTTKTRINFILPKTTINYSLVDHANSKPDLKGPQGDGAVTYNYTITL